MIVAMLLLLIFGVLILINFMTAPGVGANFICACNTLLFCSPLIFGFYVDPIDNAIKVPALTTYLVYVAPLFVFVCASFLESVVFSKGYIRSSPLEVSSSYLLFVLLVLVSLIYSQFQLLLSYNFEVTKKSELGQFSAWLVIVNSLFSLSGYWAQSVGRKKLVLVLLFLVVCSVVFTKSRSAFVFFVIGYGVGYFNERTSRTFLSKSALLLVGFFSLLSIVVVNGFLGAFLIGDFSGAYEKLFDSETWVGGVSKMQAHGNVMVADRVVTQGIVIPFNSFVSGLVRLVPYGQTIFDVQYTKSTVYFAEKFARYVDWGIAGNPLAQIYAVFGVFGLAAFSILWSGLNFFISKLMVEGGFWLRSCAYTLLPLVAFFFLRQDIWASISMIVNVVLIFIIVVFLLTVYRGLVKCLLKWVYSRA